MKKLFTLLVVLFTGTWMLSAQQGGSLSSTPGDNKISPDAAFTLTYDGTGTNFASWTPQCHAHMWLIAKDGEEFEAGSYGTTWIDYDGKGGSEAWALVPENQKMELQSTGIYTITISDLYAYFGVTEADKSKIGQLGMVVRAQYEGDQNQTINLYINVGDYEAPVIPTEDIVVRVKVPAGWDNPHLYCWGTANNGFHQLTKDGDWYVHTFEGEHLVNFLFVNGDAWSVDNNQSLDVTDLTASACFEIGNETEGKRSVNNIDCGEVTTSIKSQLANIDFNLAGNQLHVNDSGMLRVFAVSGQLIHAESINGNFNYTLNRGVYILTMDNKVEKLIVR